MASLSSLILDFNGIICAHHIYKDVWTTFTGEELTVQQDNDNEHDNYAVGVLKDGGAVRHVPKDFPHVAWHFIAHGGVISCELRNKTQKVWEWLRSSLQVFICT